jgi:hypothetical protein
MIWQRERERERVKRLTCLACSHCKPNRKNPSLLFRSPNDVFYLRLSLLPPQLRAGICDFRFGRFQAEHCANCQAYFALILLLAATFFCTPVTRLGHTPTRLPPSSPFLSHMFLAVLTVHFFICADKAKRKTRKQTRSVTQEAEPDK